MPQYIVTYTSMVIDADNEDEAIERADSGGGGHWEAHRAETFGQEDDTKARLEYLRGQIRAEQISWGEIHELQGLADQIEPGDVELLEWAGVPEHPDEECAECGQSVPADGPMVSPAHAEECSLHPSNVVEG